MDTMSVTATLTLLADEGYYVAGRMVWAYPKLPVDYPMMLALARGGISLNWVDQIRNNDECAEWCRQQEWWIWLNWAKPRLGRFESDCDLGHITLGHWPPNRRGLKLELLDRKNVQKSKLAKQVYLIPPEMLQLQPAVRVVMEIGPDGRPRMVPMPMNAQPPVAFNPQAVAPPEGAGQ